MRKLAWQKLAPLLLCGLIATGCDQDKNSLTEPINWPLELTIQTTQQDGILEVGFIAIFGSPKWLRCTSHNGELL